ncbi:sugar phosphate isomerase/epimerase family protein [Georgenia faecalis]|uniref:Sugar phosphate isomerase/epimerase family protein n=1 Tax=Georgenia faecalis TaxID=2483799 RepID=A0ABV9D6J5_9MICO|nr:sugar phosphate isomerase/epimerase family protein [Georgenia faecalis]
MRFAYGTNGFTAHRLPDALEIIAELGYAGASITLDAHHLDPFADDVAARVARTAQQLERLGLGAVVETGAPYLLDPRGKFEPSLVSDAGRDLRLDLLHRSIDIAGDLGAPVVHLWSGVLAPGTTPEVGWDRLVDGVAALLPHAERAGIVLAVEPEPSMLVSRLGDALDLRSRLGEPERLRVTLDVGHARCNEDAAPDACVRACADVLAHVQIEDMRRDVHAHLEFGEGDIDFPPVLAALDEAGYDGLVSVELGRQSDSAPEVAARSLAALHAYRTASRGAVR